MPEEAGSPHIRVRDLGSRNGTYVNGRLIGLRDQEAPPESAADKTCPSVLEDGDVLGIGPIHFRVSMASVHTVERKRLVTGIELGKPAFVESIEPSTDEMVYSI